MVFFFLSGAFIGFILTNFPRIIKYPGIDKYSPEDFSIEYPEVKWVSRFLGNVPSIWFVSYIFLFLFLTQFLHGPGLLFALTYWFTGGISLIDGIFEIVTYISPERAISMSRTGTGNKLLSLSLGGSVRIYGSIRTILVLLIGTTIPGILNITMN